MVKLRVGEGNAAISPVMFGAKGDGVLDDTAPINAMFAHVRATLNNPSLQRPIVIDGGGRVYRVTGSLNATNIANAKGWILRNLHISSASGGKVVLDLSGSRFYGLQNVNIWGEGQFDTTNRPRCGILLCRSSTYPASHINMWNVSVDGYFNVAPLHNYAAEEICAIKSTFWNRATASGSASPSDPSYAPAYAVVLDGRGTIPTRGEHVAGVSGRESFTVNNYISCAFQKPFGIAGPTMYISDMASSRFEKLYATNGAGVVFEWVLNSDYTCYDLVFDGLQVETTGNKGVFSFLGQSGQTH